MKNRMFVGLVAAATALVLSSSLAAAEDFAYSANAIGVIKKTLTQNKMTLLSIPLDQVSDEGEGFVFGSVPAISNLPNKTVAYIWDDENQVWVGQAKDKKSGWGPFETKIIGPSTPFFLKNVTNDIQFVVSGEVPSDAAMSRGLVLSNLNLVANPYPVPMVFTNFAFANTLTNKSVAYYWDHESQTWVGQAKDKKSGWGAIEDRVIAPGEGLFLKPASGSDLNWTESRPYTWPK